jgi:hypothetical protein
MIFLGYEQGSKAYRLFDPVANRVHVSRDVVFDEDASWDLSGSSHITDDAPFVVDHLVHGGAPVPAAESSAVAEKRAKKSAMAEEAAATRSPTPGRGSSPSTPLSGPPTTSPAPPSTAAATSTPNEPSPATFVSPPAGADNMLDADDDPEHPHHYRLVTDVLGRNQNAPARAERLFFVEEPNTFADAEPHSSWRQAMMEEMSSWTLADLPPGDLDIAPSGSSGSSR